MENLRKFQGDAGTRTDLIQYIHTFIGEEALRRMYARGDVSHIADAKALIDLAFEQLDIDYGIKTKQEAPTNNAR